MQNFATTLVDFKDFLRVYKDHFMFKFLKLKISRLSSVGENPGNAMNSAKIDNTNIFYEYSFTVYSP